MHEPIRTDRAEIERILSESETAETRRRRRLRQVGAAAAAIVALATWQAVRGGDAGYRYATEVAERGPLVVSVSATGVLQPTNKVDIGSELSGIVEAVLVDFNDRVEKGQILARLDVSRQRAELLQAEAELEAAEASLSEREATAVEAGAELERLRAVRAASDGRVPSRQDMDAATAAASRARAAVASSEAQIALAQAKVDYGRTTIEKAVLRTPIDGVVLSRTVEVGQTIAAALQTPVLFTIAEDLTRMELQVDVDEADIGEVREGQRAAFTVDAYPSRTFPAHIVQVRYASETIDNVVTYKAVLEVANEDIALRPGMTASADIVVAERSDALLVPNAALRFVPPEREDDASLLQKLVPFMRRRWGRENAEPTTGAERTVYVLDGDQPEAVTITAGRTDGSHTEVVGGDIEEGAKLVVDATRGEDE